MTRRLEPIVPQPPPSPEVLRAWVTDAGSPRATVYLPLQWAGPEARQNALQLENAARDLKTGLASAGLSDDAAAWSARLRAVELTAHDRPGPTGLSVLLGPRTLHAVAMYASTPYRVRVASRYALRPLLAAMRCASRYRVLAVSVGRVVLFEGGPEGLAEAPPQGLPASLEDALGAEKTENELRMRGTRAGGGAPMVYSHGAARDEKKLDLARFHEALGRVLAGRLGDGSLPMVLVATEEHQVALRAAAKIPALLAEGVIRNPDHLSPSELHDAAWPLVARWLADPTRDGASFERARKRGKALDLIDDIAAAAVSGRVRRLWVDAARSMPGCLDAGSGRVVAPGVAADDVLDALAETVIGQGGEVFPVPASDVPSSTGAAAELH